MSTGFSKMSLWGDNSPIINLLLPTLDCVFHDLFDIRYPHASQSLHCRYSTRIMVKIYAKINTILIKLLSLSIARCPLDNYCYRLTVVCEQKIKRLQKPRRCTLCPDPLESRGNFLCLGEGVWAGNEFINVY